MGPGLDEWTCLVCLSRGPVASVLAVFKGGVHVGGKTGEDKMRGLPQWETERWESSSFKEDVCLSLFSSFSQRLGNIRNPEGAHPPSLQIFYLEISRSNASFSLPSCAPNTAPTHPANRGRSAIHFHF